MFQFLGIVHFLGHLPVHLWFGVSKMGVCWHHFWLDWVRLLSEISALSCSSSTDPLVWVIGQHVVHELATSFTQPMELLL